MITKILLLFVGAILAFLISAICGGGASLILLPILNMLLIPSSVPFALTIGTFTSSASRIYVFRDKINWKIFIWFVPFSIPAVLIGAYLLKFVNPIYLQLVVGLFLLANIPQLFFSRKEHIDEEKPYPQYILGIVGFFAGFVSGITGAVGLLFNKFYLKYGLSKEEIIATRSANEIFLHLIKLFIYIFFGLFTTKALWLGLTIAIASIISSYSVKFILPYFSEYLFRKIGYGAMVISGMVLLFTTGQKVITQDNIRLTNNSVDSKNEAVLSWRNSDFTLEYSLNDELEFEKSLHPDDLDENLKLKYNQMLKDYDYILIEKVYKITEKNSYEFYCYKDGKVTKFDIK